MNIDKPEYKEYFSILKSYATDLMKCIPVTPEKSAEIYIIRVEYSFSTHPNQDGSITYKDETQKAKAIELALQSLKKLGYISKYTIDKFQSPGVVQRGVSFSVEPSALIKEFFSVQFDQLLKETISEWPKDYKQEFINLFLNVLMCQKRPSYQGLDYVFIERASQKDMRHEILSKLESLSVITNLCERWEYPHRDILNNGSYGYSFRITPFFIDRLNEIYLNSSNLARSEAAVQQRYGISLGELEARHGPQKANLFVNEALKKLSQKESKQNVLPIKTSTKKYTKQTNFKLTELDILVKNNKSNSYKPANLSEKEFTTAQILMNNEQGLSSIALENKGIKDASKVIERINEKIKKCNPNYEKVIAKGKDTVFHPGAKRKLTVYSWNHCKFTFQKIPKNT